VLVAPLLAIEGPADRAPLEALAHTLADYRYVVFVSQNAVAHACPVLLAAGGWPANTRAVVLGPGSAAALKAWGVHDVILPAGPFDSETLLQHPALQQAAVRGAKVVILRGNGGRELLATTLAARGAWVDCLSCYRRTPADIAPLRDALAAGVLSALSITSSEALRHVLAELAGEDAVWRVPLFVPHQRIADAARDAGFRTVVLTPPGDAGLVAGMEQYFAAK
jgi:uroporphyrinogen-III synthase